ncbi:LysR family transcriptional regulator [Roseovarius aestuarii]|uniref:HTH-type transcriptional regulator GbpR n=1 Tax=Roseovarius aestuarii TaxID=475083 RepID=A0A1X7BQ28_9RHOB|nr:LysR substrate-binding domain-containing protein [Roseovarius aestuarii]SMC11660.1 HTH-type transcriptional regulator GbpR [Roseovarius aestuarii]
MRLKLRHLEVFSALFDAGSVSRAAQRLNLSQPAVSVALGNFEAELGFRLFHRDRGFFAPTNEAILLHEEVQQGITALTRVEQRADEIRSGATAGISVATNGAMSYNFLPKVIAEFQRDYPGTHVELRVHSSRRIASWVGSRQIDIGLIDAPVPVAGLNTKLVHMECVCIMREDDPLARLEIITPKDLNNRPVIAITGDHSIDRQLAEIMSLAEMSLIHNASSYFYAIARNLVAAGNNISIIDPVNGKAALADGVVWRPFAPKIIHELAVITNKGQPVGIAATQFEKRIGETLQQYAIPKRSGKADDSR